MTRDDFGRRPGPGRRNGSSAGWRPTGPADAPAPPDADGYQLRGLLHGHRMHCHKPARWGWVFDELEAEFEDGLRREAEQETMAPVGAEVGSAVAGSTFRY